MGLRNPDSIDAQVDFISTLIQTGPVYASPEGQRECAESIAESLEDFDWDEVLVQEYSADELSNDPNYVPVEKFGGQYSNDRSRTKQNVIGILRSSNPGNTLILNGHYDVEAISHEKRWTLPWNGGQVSDGKVWGRGSSDMLSGLASQMYVASRLAQDRDSWSGQIIFNAVADEEIGGNGTLASLHALDEMGCLELPDKTACLIAEPSDRIVGTESLGFLHMILRARGIARHMAGTALRGNVLYEMIDTITDFENILKDVAHDLSVEERKICHTFGLIQGGIDAATPMPEIEAESVVFYPPQTTAQQITQAIRARTGIVHPDIDTDFSDFYFGGHASSDNSGLVRLLVDTAHNQTVDKGLFPSPCDARLFTAFGISDVVVYGPGSLAQAHTANEFINISDIENYNLHLETAMRLYLNG